VVEKDVGQMKHVTVRKKCLECKEGELIFTGTIFTLTCNPPITSYDHKCNSCQREMNLPDQAFPYTYTEYDKDEKREEWQ
jgi:hypothetical protein